MSEEAMQALVRAMQESGASEEAIRTWYLDVRQAKIQELSGWERLGLEMGWVQRRRAALHTIRAG